MSLEGPGKKKNSLRTAIDNALRTTVVAGTLLSGPSPLKSEPLDVAAVETVSDVSQEKHNLDSLISRISKAEDGMLALHTLQDMSPFLTDEQRAEMMSLLPKNTSFAVAALAHQLSPDYRVFLQDPVFSHVNKINRDLLRPLIIHREMTTEDWAKLQDNFNYSEDASDKAEQAKLAPIKMELLYKLSEQYNGADPTEVEASAAIVMRNLNTLGVKVPTDTEVHANVEEILKQRESLANFDVFKGRNVVLISHDELLDKDYQGRHRGEPRFGTEELKEGILTRQASGQILRDVSIKQISPLSFDGTSYHSTPASVYAAKMKAIEAISTSQAPLTVYFDVHGMPDGIYISDNKQKNSVISEKYLKDAVIENVDSSKIEGREKITVDELAGAIEAQFHLQQKTNPGLKESNLILLFSACNMHQFTQSLSKKLAERKVPQPELVLSASQEGQVSYSLLGEPTGSGLNDLLIKSPSVGSIIHDQINLFGEHPNIFVPVQNHPGKMMQISGLATASFGAVA